MKWNKNHYNRQSKKRKKTTRIVWETVSSKQSAPIVPTFDELNESEEHSILLPIDSFKELITDDFLKFSVEQSNLHSIQKNPNKPLYLYQLGLEQWLVLCMHMSFSRIFNTWLYWSGMNDIIASLMIRDKWEQIKLNLHFMYITFNKTEKLSKMRPLVNHREEKLWQIS